MEAPEKNPSHILIEALSPSAPAEQEVEFGPAFNFQPGDDILLPGDQFKNDRGEWCTLKEKARGFHDIVYRRRRFHPATSQE